MKKVTIKTYRIPFSLFFPQKQIASPAIARYCIECKLTGGRSSAAGTIATNSQRQLFYIFPLLFCEGGSPISGG